MADLVLYDIFDISPLCDFIRSRGELRVFKKGEYFCRLGSPAPDIAVVRSGGFAFSRPDYKGDSQTFSLAFSGEIIGAYVPMMFGRTSPFDSTALCRSEIHTVPLKEAMRFMDDELPPSFRLEFIRAVAYGFMMRMMGFRCNSPEERYRELLVRVPEIVGQMSNSAIAPYLGITRETFSRMRSRMGK